MIIFPDQYGEQKEDSMSFTEAQHHEENSVYGTILRWLHRKLPLSHSSHESHEPHESNKPH